MKITLNRSEYRAIEDLRGLPQGAHMLIMRSSGGVLEGSEQDFDELVSHISEEMAYDMLSARAARALLSACIKINPDCADWLGM